MPAVSKDIETIGKEYTEIMKRTKRKIAVLYYFINDDTKAVACAIANALDADCIAISARSGNKDNLFIFSKITKYDIIIFGTPLINGRVPETVEQFFLASKKNISCKSIHFFVTTLKPVEKPFDGLRKLITGKDLTMPTAPTSTLMIKSKEVNRFVSKALLCSISSLQYQDIFKILGFHAYLNHHDGGCKHQLECKRRHHRHHKEEPEEKPKKETKKKAAKVAVEVEVEKEETSSKSEEKKSEESKSEEKKSEESKSEESKSEESKSEESKSEESKSEESKSEESEEKDEESESGSGSGSGSASGSSSESD